MKVPSRVSDGEVVARRTVPDEWADQRDRADRFSRAVDAHLGDESGDGYRGVALTPTDTTTDGHAHLGVTVYAEAGSDVATAGSSVLDADALDTDVPDDVPVSVERVQTGDETDTAVTPEYYDGPYQTLRGGVSMVATGNGGSTRFSLGACAKHNGERVLIVSRHPFTSDGNCCDTDTVRSRCEQAGRSVAALTGPGQPVDSGVAMVTNSSISITNEIVDQDGAVQGHIPEPGVTAAMASSGGLRVRFRGRASGEKQGEVTGVKGGIDCPDPARNIRGIYHVEFDSGPTREGDSGGPVYRYDNGNVLLLGFLIGTDTEDDRARVVAASRVADKFDPLTFTW